MLTDYKFTAIINHDNGGQTIAVQFFEGEITTEDDYDQARGEMLPVTRYRRARMIKQQTITLDAAEDLPALQRRLNDVLATDETRTSIDEQTVD